MSFIACGIRQWSELRHKTSPHCTCLNLHDNELSVIEESLGQWFPTLTVLVLSSNQVRKQ